jgi:hypothetical protein
MDLLKTGVTKSVQRSAVSDQLERPRISTTEGLMKDFKDLKVWKKSHDLTLAVYVVTKLSFLHR